MGSAKGGTGTGTGCCFKRGWNDPPWQLHPFSSRGFPRRAAQRENGSGSTGRGKVSAWALPSAHSPLIELLTPGNPLP